MKLGRVVITYQAMLKVLDLPPGTEIVAVPPQTADEVGNCLLSFIVVGDEMPEHIEGSPVEVVSTPWRLGRW